MIKVYSQRLTPPYSGQAQIAESERARAITMDGKVWEIHFVHSTPGGVRQDGSTYDYSFRRVAFIRHADLDAINQRAERGEQEVDERITELTRFLAGANLPFKAADKYEYWLLDPVDESPLALIFSCKDQEQMSRYPDHPEWTALPASAMPVEKTEEELAQSAPPVNYRVEGMVRERAGTRPRARWFNRERHTSISFPPFMIREDWQDEQESALCQRYIQRQSTRLLMLHGLGPEDRLRMELSARSHPLEVARFFDLYPEVADNKVMNAIRVEARLREAEQEESFMLQRRDGILYI